MIVLFHSADTKNLTDASTIGTVSPPLNKVDKQLFDMVYIANPNSIWVNYSQDLGNAETVGDILMVRLQFTRII